MVTRFYGGYRPHVLPPVPTSLPASARLFQRHYPFAYACNYDGFYLFVGEKLLQKQSNNKYQLFINNLNKHAPI